MLLRFYSGYISTRTSAKTPITDWSTAQRGMLVYDIQSKTLRNESMDGYGRGNEGFEYGTLDWIPNDGKGLLVSLMGERQAINSPNETSDYLNGESVRIVTIQYAIKWTDGV